MAYLKIELNCPTRQKKLQIGCHEIFLLSKGNFLNIILIFTNSTKTMYK